LILKTRYRRLAFTGGKERGKLHLHKKKRAEKVGTAAVGYATASDLEAGEVRGPKKMSFSGRKRLDEKKTEGKKP